MDNYPKNWPYVHFQLYYGSKDHKTIPIYVYMQLQYGDGQNQFYVFFFYNKLKLLYEDASRKASIRRVSFVKGV